MAVAFDPNGPLTTPPAYMQQQAGVGGGFRDPMTLALLGASAGFLDPHGGMMGGFQGAMQGMYAGNQMQQQAAQQQMIARKLQKQIEIENYMKGLAAKHQGNPQAMAKEMMSSGLPDLMQQGVAIGKGLGTKYMPTQDANGNQVYATGDNFGNITPTDARVPSKLMSVNTGDRNYLVDQYSGDPRKAFDINMSTAQQAQLGQSQNQFNMTHALAQQNAARAQDNFNTTNALQRYKAVQPKYVDGAYMYPPTAENPQGGMIKTEMFTAPKGSEAEKAKMSDKIKNTLGGDTEQLIRQATGSMIGAGVDAGAALFGGTTKGAEANAALKLRAATLAGNMPRFEGPQSDADRKYYLEMAGDLANPSKTTIEKLQALKELKRIHNIADQNGGMVNNVGSGQGSSGGWSVQRID